jgi:DNA-binding winged helix-turn-helix (wHTH) protein
VSRTPKEGKLLAIRQFCASRVRSRLQNGASLTCFHNRMSQRVQINRERRELRCNGELVPVQRRVFDLLVYLEAHSERAIPRDELLREVWADANVTEASLHQAVRAARRAIGDDPLLPKMLVSVRGYGYRWVAKTTGSRPRGDAPGSIFGDETEKRDDEQGGESCAWLIVVAGAEGAMVERAPHRLDDIDEVSIQRANSPVSFRTGRTLSLGASSPILSRLHARIVRESSRFVLEDLESTNGTRVMGRPVHRIDLRDGDWIGCGPMLLRFRLGAPDCERIAPSLAVSLAPSLSRAACVLREGTPVVISHRDRSDPRHLARVLHAMTGRRGEFVELDAGSLDQPSMTQQLSRATSGTLHLTDAGSMSSAMFHTLMRAVDRVTTRSDPPDIVLIASTSDRVRTEFETLGAHQFVLPSLIDRLEDLGAMLHELDNAPRGYSMDALDALALHSWPGDDRELANIVRSARVFAGEDTVELEHLPLAMRDARPRELR